MLLIVLPLNDLRFCNLKNASQSENGISLIKVIGRFSPELRVSKFFLKTGKRSRFRVNESRSMRSSQSYLSKPRAKRATGLRTAKNRHLREFRGVRVQSGNRPRQDYVHSSEETIHRG